MRIFLLAGQSIENREWIEGVEKEFKKEFQDTEILYYEHWNTGEKEIDVKKEVERFLNSVNNFEGQYLVFAKSFGTIIFLNSLDKLKNKPKGVLMVGLCFRLALMKNYDFEILKEKADFKIKIFQKELDPAGFLKEIKKLSGGMVKVEEYKCFNEEKDNHYYANTEYLLKLMKELS